MLHMVNKAPSAFRVQFRVQFETEKADSPSEKSDGQSKMSD